MTTRVFATVRGQVQAWWQAVAGSLWFVPALLIGASVILALLLIELSTTIDREALRNFPRLFGAGAESSRSMLSTIAGAMMTVAGVTFSITVLAVTQASSQYTPRILRNFMRDRPSQVALGTLTGVFVYCLVVLRTVRGEEDILFIPALAVLGAFVLAIVAIGVLVYFIHHIASSLQASGILDRVRRETTAAVEQLFPDELGDEAESPTHDAERIPVDARWRTVAARRTGYLARIDADGMLAFAEEEHTVVRMAHGIGEYVVAGTPLCAVLDSVRDPASRTRDAERLDALHTVEVYRTVQQDPAFGVRQIVDIALKALSPGINDTTTAVMCIDSLGAILVHVAERRVENEFRESHGELRVIAIGPTFESLVASAVDEIRRNAEGNVTVLAHLLRTMAVVAGCTKRNARRAVLREHASRIYAASERSVRDVDDRREVGDAYHHVLRVLERQPAPRDAAHASGRT